MMKQRFMALGSCMVLVVYLLIAAVLMMERSGIRLNLTLPESRGVPLENYAFLAEAMAEQETECLLLVDSTDAASLLALEQYQQILSYIKVGYRTADLSKEPLPELAPYRTCVALLKNLGVLGSDVIRLTDWVYAGGRVQLALTIAKETCFMLIEQKLGILESSYDNAVVDSIWFDAGFLVGGGQAYAIPDGYDSAMRVALSERAHVVARLRNETGMPLIWWTDYGAGRFVVDNFDVMERSTRGLYAASYALLEDAFAYPVLNAEAFYLDDCPSPVPSGDSSYILRDFHMPVEDFYSSIWWRDMMQLAQRWSIRYTGLVIENYGDETRSKTERQRDTARFQFFGNMLLHMGGEIGYHGYNHQPLCFTDEIDYGGALSYNTWPDEDAAAASLSELDRFIREQFATVNPSVYVPPSNVIGERGERMIAQRFPNITAIAGSYFSEEASFVRGQEFDKLSDTLYAQPRVTSGEEIDDFTMLTALSELNLHAVNTHFIHPDDALDPDRGADLGWNALFAQLSGYMDWLFDAAPFLRRMTGSELTRVEAAYCDLRVKRTVTPSSLRLDMGDESVGCWFYVRVGGREIGRVEGGRLTLLSPSLGLVEATRPHVEIWWNEQ